MEHSAWNIVHEQPGRTKNMLMEWAAVYAPFTIECPMRETVVGAGRGAIPDGGTAAANSSMVEAKEAIWGATESLPTFTVMLGAGHCAVQVGKAPVALPTAVVAKSMEVMVVKVAEITLTAVAVNARATMLPVVAAAVDTVAVDISSISTARPNGMCASSRHRL